jgi:hypothetical protein
VPDVHDEELMRRFLLGEVSPAERERVEQRFIDDPDFFDALCGLEQELIVSHLRGELPEPLRSRFDARAAASESLRREIEQTAALTDALAPRGTGAASPPAHLSRRVAFDRRILIAAAAAVVLLAAGVWWLQRARVTGPAGGDGTPGDPGAGAIATLVLLPGTTRSDVPQANVFRVPSGTRSVRLQLTTADAAVAGARATVRPVGGAPLAVSSVPEIARTGESFTVSWVVPAAILRRGDYVWTMSRDQPPGEPIASRFFSIVE